MVETRTMTDLNGRLDKGISGSRLNEAQLIVASQKGDLSAFNQLVVEWQRGVYNLTLRMLGNEDEAAEATQEVFLSAFRAIRRFRLESRFSTWLYRIAANHCLTRLKQRPRLVPVSLDQEETQPLLERHVAVTGSQVRDLLQRERREKIRQALSRLSPPQRMVVELKVFQDQKFEEISQSTETPLSTVKSQFYSALGVLRRSLSHLSPEI